MKASVWYRSESHFSMSDGIGKAVPAHFFNLDSTRKLYLYAWVDQVVDSTNHLGNIDELHYHSSAKSPWSFKYDYTHGIIKMYHPPAISLEAVKYVAATQNIFNETLLKYGSFEVILYGWHQCFSVETLINEDSVGYVLDFLCMNYELLM